MLNTVVTLLCLSGLFCQDKGEPCDCSDVYKSVYTLLVRKLINKKNLFNFEKGQKRQRINNSPISPQKHRDDRLKTLIEYKNYS